MRKVLLILFISILTITLTGCSNKELTDSEKFKKEYESINNKEDDNGKKYREVSIPKDNPIVYSTADEIVKKISNKESFIVFFAYKECPWSRSVIEELLEVAKDSNVDKIYYVDIKDIVNKKDLDKDYLTLINKFSNVLDDYKIPDNDKKISTEEKRINAPSLIAVSQGKAIKLKTGVNKDLKDPYQKLTDKIKKDIYNEFKCIFKCLEEESTTCQKDTCTE